MTTEQMQERIEINARVMAGKPVIRGTRIPVALLVRLVAQGISEAEILKQYPRLQQEDIRAALTYAALVLAHEADLPPAPPQAVVEYGEVLPLTPLA